MCTLLRLFASALIYSAYLPIKKNIDNQKSNVCTEQSFKSQLFGILGDFA